MKKLALQQQLVSKQPAVKMLVAKELLNPTSLFVCVVGERERDEI